MTDIMTPQQRHYCMSRIRSKDTTPEKRVRQWLWKHGYRYRLNVKGVPGKPDTPSLQIENSACCKIPKTNRDFWVAKIRRNQERDQNNYEILSENGWQVIVLWECQLKPKKLEQTMREVEVALQDYYLRTFSRKAKPYIHIDEEEMLPMVAEDPEEYGLNL